MPRLDRTFKALAEGDPDSMVRLVCGIPWDQPLNIQPIDREVIIPARPVDHAYLIGDRGGHALHMEAFAYAGHEAANQQIWHAVLIAAKLRKPVRSYMVLLSPRYPGNRLGSPAALDLGDLHVQLDHRRVRMWEKDPAWVLEADRPYLLPWVAAMKSRESDILEAARRIRLQPDLEMSRGLMSELAILLGIRYTRQEIKAFTGELRMLINEEIVKESVPVQDYAAKVRREGRAEGKAAGVTEGKAAGRAEGRIEQARESVRTALRLRFPKSPAMDEIDSIDDLDRLRALFAAIMTAKSAAELRRKLLNGSNGTH